MTGIPAAEWEFYESFYALRVMPKVSKEMGDCQGFFPWLAEHDPALYAGISAADEEINALWLSRGDKAAFKEACKTWYALLMDAKKGFDAWKAKERERALMAGRQEALVLR